MTVVSTVFLGSAQGSAQLLREAFGRRLRDQFRGLGVVVLDAAATRRGAGTLAEALADERAVVTSTAGSCRALLVLDETDVDGQAADRVTALAAVCGEPALQVVLTVERQDRRAEHARVDALRTGRPDLADTADGGAVHDHAADVRALSELPVVAGVRARPYELVQAGTAAFVDDALALAGLRGRLDLRAVRRRGDELTAYRTYSPRAVALSRALQDESTTPRERELLHEFLLTAFPGGRLLDPAARLAIVERHREPNEAFLLEHVPDVPPGSYADDDATARLADILVPPRIPPPGPGALARTVHARLLRDVRRRLDRGE